MQIHIHAAHVTIGAAAALSSLAMPGNADAFVGAELVSTGAIPAIGKDWHEQAGVVAGYMPPEDGKPGYWLIAPTDPAAEAESLKWGQHGKLIEGLCARDGLANTRLLAEAGPGHAAALFCRNLRLGNFDDFYLPSRREASLLAATVPHLFKTGWHWTSTQSSAYYAFGQAFSGGDQFNGHKGDEWRVRAVRRFLIP